MTVVPVIVGDVPTPQGRIYPEALLYQVADDFNARIAAGGPIHGEPAEGADGTAISVARITHRVTSVVVQDGTLYATIDLMPTPMMLNLKGAAKLDFGKGTPRGIGKVAEDGTVSDYRLITVDLPNKE